MKVKLWIDVGYVAGAAYDEIMDAPELDDMPRKERDKYLDELASDFLHNHVEYGAEIVSEEVEE